MKAERVRVIDHKGKQIVFYDLSGLTGREILDPLVAGSRVVRSKPLSSVLTLVDASTLRIDLRGEGGAYDRVTTDAIRGTIAGNAPYVKATAIVIGTGESKRIILEFLGRGGGRNFEPLDTVEQALDWLVTQ